MLPPRYSSFCERHAGIISILAMLHLVVVVLALRGGDLWPRSRRPISHVLRTYQQLAGLASEAPAAATEAAPEAAPEAAR